MGVGEQIIGELSVRRLGLAACSLEIVDMSEDTQSTTTFPPCDTLILKAVFSEVEPLSDQCANLEILCKKRCHAFLGSYYDLGTVGTESVVAVRAEGYGATRFWQISRVGLPLPKSHRRNFCHPTRNGFRCGRVEATDRRCISFDGCYHSANFRVHSVDRAIFLTFTASWFPRPERIRGTR